MKEFLLSWLRKDVIDDKMYYKKPAEWQEIFVRDDVCLGLLNVPVFAISTHCSKSITLPVYGFTMRNGIKVICRDNFYDWKVSVQIPDNYEVIKNAIPEDLVNDGYKNDISDCYFEGFKKEWCFPAYNPDNTEQHKFSIEVYGDYRLYTLLYILKNLYKDVDVDAAGVDVEKSINKLYKEFSVDNRNLSGSELLTDTYRNLDDYDFRKAHGISESFYDIYKDPKRFAEEIVKYPEILKIFLMEKYLLEMEY